MSEKRPYMNPETGEIKMLTEEEAEKLNEKEAEKQNKEKLTMQKLKLGGD